MGKLFNNFAVVHLGNRLPCQREKDANIEICRYERGWVFGPKMWRDVWPHTVRRSRNWPRGIELCHISRRLSGGDQRHASMIGIVQWARFRQSASSLMTHYYTDVNSFRYEHQTRVAIRFIQETFNEILLTPHGGFSFSILLSKKHVFCKFSKPDQTKKRKTTFLVQFWFLK